MAPRGAGNAAAREQWIDIRTRDLRVNPALKTTRYFEATRERADRRAISLEWIARVVTRPEHERTQADGRIRRWGSVPEAGGRLLRVVLLADGQTVHNAFFDRSFKP